MSQQPPDNSRVQIATSRHLQQPAQYRSADGRWYRTPSEALAASPGDLTWDPIAAFSEVSLGYACGERTLVREVERQPWMSSVTDDGSIRLEQIPPHDTRGYSPEKTAERLRELIEAEALAACKDFGEIYVLLSGGLDSRVVAIILRNLYQQGHLKCKPVAVTWGLEDSRDVVYGQEIAQILGFEWQHIGLGPQHLLENIEHSACELGGLAWPTDIHRTGWFQNVSPNALVLAATSGDTVGRGESGRATVLEWKGLQPGSDFDLLRREVLNVGAQGLYSDIQALRGRVGTRPDYGVYECEDSGHCERGQLNQAMGLINRYCHFYQMFTDPDLFSFMWSVHPSLRTDEVYARLLMSLDKKLAHFPWARTNRSVAGRTIGAHRGLRQEYELYRDWVCGPLYDELRQRIDPEWFGATGLFDDQAVYRLGELVRSGGMRLRLQGKRPYCTWLWLAVFRRFWEHVQELNKNVCLDLEPVCATDNPWSGPPSDSVGTVRRVLRHSPFLLNCVRTSRRRILRRRALRAYPPI